MNKMDNRQSTGVAALFMTLLALLVNCFSIATDHWLSFDGVSACNAIHFFD